MLANLFLDFTDIFLIIGYTLSFGLTALLLSKLQNKLPRDGGRKFAVNGELSQGKARGAGVIIIPVMLLCALLFIPLSSLEFPIYCFCIFAAMMSGYLDDASETPWNEYKKGIIDFAIAIILAITYVHYNGSSVNLLLFHTSVDLPAWLFVILAVILIWVSINVVNCSDGVDGLCASLSIVSFLGFLFVLIQAESTTAVNPMTIMFVMALLAYLWFNAKPSTILMGDAGSRALGLFLALLALFADPFLFIPLGIVFIIDGGLGLVKVSIIRFLKIKVMTNLRTPIHDHFRKNTEPKWSDTQVVFRFVIIQTVIAILVVAIVSL